MMKTLFPAFLACACAAACTDENPEYDAQLELSITGDVDYAAYRISVLDLRSGDALVQRTTPVKADDETRFAAALPAGRALLVDVVGTDPNGLVMGSGAAVITLQPAVKTTINIGVLAKPGDVGVLDARLSEAQLPQRDFLLADPAQATPNSQQQLVAKLVDTKTKQPVTDAAVIGSPTGAVAPMFIPGPNDGTITASFQWEKPQQFPATATASYGYFDSEGRGWVATVTANFDSLVMPVDVEFRWTGQIVLSGIVAPDMLSGIRWALGLADSANKGASPALVAMVDQDDDGVFETSKAFPTNGRIIPFSTDGATGIVMPVDLGGAIFDSNGDQVLDSIVTIAKGGLVTTSPWPLE